MNEKQGFPFWIESLFVIRYSLFILTKTKDYRVYHKVHLRNVPSG